MVEDEGQYCPDEVALQQWQVMQSFFVTGVRNTLADDSVVTFHCCVGGGGGGNRFNDRKGISSIKHENLGYSEKPDWLNTKATVTFIRHDGTYCYAACPEEGNNKKVIEQSDGSWLCEVCS